MKWNGPDEKGWLRLRGGLFKPDIGKLKRRATLRVW